MSIFLEVNRDLMGIKASDSGCQLPRHYVGEG